MRYDYFKTIYQAYTKEIKNITSDLELILSIYQAYFSDLKYIEEVDSNLYNMLKFRQLGTNNLYCSYLDNNGLVHIRPFDNLSYESRLCVDKNGKSLFFKGNDSKVVIYDGVLMLLKVVYGYNSSVDAYFYDREAISEIQFDDLKYDYEEIKKSLKSRNIDCDARIFVSHMSHNRSMNVEVWENGYVKKDVVCETQLLSKRIMSNLIGALELEKKELDVYNKVKKLECTRK